MNKKRTIGMAAMIGFSIVAAIWMLRYGVSYASIVIAAGTLLAAIISLWELIKHEKGHKLGEHLFSLKFGVKPDKTKVLSIYISKYDHLKGVSTNSVRIKFWSQGKVYKGLVDIENESLHIREPVLLPLYTDDLVPVWEEVTRVHRNGKPKTVEFRDAAERLHRVDYLDEEGMLKNLSWRRYKGMEVRWNPVKQVWEPQ